VQYGSLLRISKIVIFDFKNKTQLLRVNILTISGKELLTV